MPDEWVEKLLKLYQIVVEIMVDKLLKETDTSGLQQSLRGAETVGSGIRVDPKMGPFLGYLLDPKMG